MTILLLPFALGQILQKWLRPLVAERKALVTWMDRSAIAIAVYVAFSGAVVDGALGKVSASEFAVLGAAIAAFLAFGFGGAMAPGSSGASGNRDAVWPSSPIPSTTTSAGQGSSSRRCEALAAACSSATATHPATPTPAPTTVPIPTATPTPLLEEEALADLSDEDLVELLPESPDEPGDSRSDELFDHENQNLSEGLGEDV